MSDEPFTPSPVPLMAADKARDIGRAHQGWELKIERIDGRINLLAWMVGAVATVIVVIGAPSVWMLARIASKIGALD